MLGINLSSRFYVWIYWNSCTDPYKIRGKKKLTCLKNRLYNRTVILWHKIFSSRAAPFDSIAYSALSQPLWDTLPSKQKIRSMAIFLNPLDYSHCYKLSHIFKKLCKLFSLSWKIASLMSLHDSARRKEWPISSHLLMYCKTDKE